jgi:hypothetical protein
MPKGDAAADAANDLAEVLLTQVEVGAPPLVLETAQATVAVAKVEDMSGAKFELPGGTTIAFPAIDLGGGGAIKVVAFKANPFPAAVGTPDSQVLSIDIGRKVADLAEPIVFTLAIDNVNDTVYDPSGEDPSSINCGYWDETKQNWKGRGCNMTALTDTGAECACTHLTVFAAMMQGFLATLMCANVQVLSKWIAQFYNDTNTSDPGSLRRLSYSPFDSYGLEWPLVVEFHGGTRTDAVVQLAMGYEELLADAVARWPRRWCTTPTPGGSSPRPATSGAWTSTGTRRPSARTCSP